jgi:hypothetical protein
MKRLSYIASFFSQVFRSFLWRCLWRKEDEQRPVVLSDAVLTTVSKDALFNARIFNPEFYRKFNPDLDLSTDVDAIKHWTSSGANHCLSLALGRSGNLRVRPGRAP